MFLVQLGMPEIFNAKKSGWSIPELERMKNSGKYNSQWGSLMVSPENVNFESLDENEVILLLGRRHFITNLSWICISGFLLLVPLFWGLFPFFSSLTDNVHLAVVILWYLGISFFVQLNLLMWFYNVYIVSNERLISVDFFGLMNKSINVTQIGRLEDVSYQQKGLMASFFNYGDVIAETASEQRTADVNEGEPSSFTFESVGNPNEVVRIISDLMEVEEHELLNGLNR